MDIKQRIKAFEEFAKVLENSLRSDSEHDIRSPALKDLYIRANDLIKNTEKYNGWFTHDNIKLSMQAIAGSLSCMNIKLWADKYKDDLIEDREPKTIGVVLAGNIPMVGFFDLFHVLMSGNKFLGKLSSQDNKLLPLLSEILISIENGFADMIEFTEDRLNDFDAVIATGSANTSRYFDYYFGKYPNIIRKNRSSVAVLSGRESCEELQLLGNDIFSYFGLGCRNVSKIYVPHSYIFSNFFEAISPYSNVINNNKYRNNYDYYKSIYLLNKEPFSDAGFIMMKESTAISSPVSVIYFEFYDDLSVLKLHLSSISNQIQCIVSDASVIPDSTPFGSTQHPQLWDYADNVDTMKFLINLE